MLPQLLKEYMTIENKYVEDTGKLKTDKRLEELIKLNDLMLKPDD